MVARTSGRERVAGALHDGSRTTSCVVADGTEVHVRISAAADGDFHRTEVPFDELEARRRAFVDLPWTMLDEVHGVTVRQVTEPGEHDGACGDVAVTGIDGVVLGAWVGDCAPLVMIGTHGRFAVAHAGWRGLAAGIVDVAADALGEPVESIVMGPAIGPCCYEFGRDDLDAVAAAVGAVPDAIAGRTAAGKLALDLEAAVRVAAGRRFGAHAGSFARMGGCTGCSYPGFSHRVRRDPQRHVLAAWRSPARAA